MFTIETAPGLSVVRGDVTGLAALLVAENIPEPNRDQWSTDLSRIGSTASRIDFGKIANADEAARIFTTDGWQDGADRARREIPTLGLSDLAPHATATKRRRQFADTGDTVRIDPALAGQWERAYETRARRQTRVPVALSVGCAFGGNADVSHSEMFWNGLQMAALCDLLEGAGWRVELRALKSNDFGRGRIHAQDWTVKQADQPLRLDTVLALFGHAGVYRTFGWAANKASAYKTPTNGGTVQYARDMRNTFDRLASAGLAAPVSIIVPQAFTRNAALANLRTALAAVAQAAGGVAA